MDKKVFCVISHTHWDREWYQPFEKFRMRLCDLINNLLKILKTYPDYIFHLDAQTIVLEDYLVIYPENREILESYIKSGNIVVGPWYVQNDFYLSSGEATVRNIMIGKEMAENFGKCANVGYTPDQFGLCSQLPQIFKDFGIDYHLFGRGYTFYEKVDNEVRGLKKDINFHWKSPDGSFVNSTLMPFWYNNAQRISAKIDTSINRLCEAKNNFEMFTKSPYLLMMNGVDHLEAQDDLLPIIDEINARMKDDEIVQCTMEEALKKTAEHIYDSFEGELRYGSEPQILSGTLSTRTDIKKLNFEAQNTLEHKVEPLYSLISLTGANIYPENQIKYLWKTLIPNHAHDSICCCSNGNVMKHMQDRYMSMNEISSELITRGARFINHHITRDVNGDGVYYLTVINTNQTDYSGVMECSININLNEADKDFKIYSPDGEEVPFIITSKEQSVFSTFSPLNLPGCVDVVNYKIQLEVKDVPAFGYVNYTVKTGFEHQNEQCEKVLENNNIKVDFDDNTINLYDKKNNQYYKNILRFEDVGDGGEVYIFQPFENDKPYDAKLEKIECLYKNPLKSAVRLSYTLTVPEGKDETSRCGEMVENKISVILSLGKYDEALSVDVEIENNTKYHLLKAVVDTGIDNTVTYASSVYDIIKRDSKDINHDVRTCSSQPNNGFIYKKTDKNGIAVYTKGIYEYENENNKLIKLSLLRSIDLISGGVSDPDSWGVKDNLMLWKTNLSFAIMPFDGDDKLIPAKEQNINEQPIYYCDSTNIRMFTGGRAAVQDGDVAELYFPKDEYETLKLPHKKGIIKVNNELCVTALKKAEKSNDIILRVYNPTDDIKEDVLSFEDCKTVKKTNMAEVGEAEFDNTLLKKKILTVVIK